MTPPLGGQPASQGRERQPSVAARSIWMTLYNNVRLSDQCIGLAWDHPNKHSVNIQQILVEDEHASLPASQILTSGGFDCTEFYLNVDIGVELPDDV